MNMEEKTQLTSLIYEDQRVFEVLEKVLLSGSVTVINRNKRKFILWEATVKSFTQRVDGNKL